MATPAVHSPSAEEQVEYEDRLRSATAQELAVPVTEVEGRPVIWSPQAGSQNAFLQCAAFEVLFHGTRGPGKTDSLLMSFAQYVGRGYGAAWTGIIFRQTYPQLADIQAKSEKWFKQIFGAHAKFNKSKMMWEWSTGEKLYFRHMNRPSDYWNYHGHEYPFIGWEELTNWPSDECFKSMFACCRCSVPGVPRMVRGTTNPYGPGHSWVKLRYRLAGQWWKTVIIDDAKDDSGRLEPMRVAIHGHIDENKILLAADPMYKQTIVASAKNKAMAEAWLNGSWDIVAGGMFGEVWLPQFNIVPVFAIPPQWRMDRSFDWGSSAPFSVGWWTESDGSDLMLPGGKVMSTVRGDLFRVDEWYGWSGKPNEGLGLLAEEIALGIVEREIKNGWRRKIVAKAKTVKEFHRVQAGPADSSIFAAENGMQISADMEKPVRTDDGTQWRGVRWVPADKRPGSRKTGWESMRSMMKNAHHDGKKPREKPGLFVTENCHQFIRTVPALPRDERDPDDVDTDAEDHIGDEARYRVRASGNTVRSGKTTGHH